MTIVVDASQRRDAVLVSVLRPLDPDRDFRTLYDKTHDAWYALQVPVIYQIINLGEHDLEYRDVVVLLREIAGTMRRTAYDVKPIIVAHVSLMHDINAAIDESALGQTPVFDGLDDAYSYIDGQHVELGAKRIPPSKEDF